MNYRTKTFWGPGLVSLTGSMALRLILQRTVEPSQTLLNHAGLPVIYQLLWLAALPLFGATSAHFSRRAGANRSTALTAVLFPSIVMIPLWMTLATKMSHPSPRQWFGLFSGVLNWIVLPGVALSLGAWPFLRRRSANESTQSANSRTINVRTKTFWFPALVSLTTAMVCLTISLRLGLQSRFVSQGWATLAIYIPWLVTLPLCGAAGASLSRRAGGGTHACFAAGLFPVIVLTGLVGFLTLIGEFVYAKPQVLYFSVAVLLGVIIPGLALLSGAMPFMRAPKRQTLS